MSASTTPRRLGAVLIAASVLGSCAGTPATPAVATLPGPAPAPVAPAQAESGPPSQEAQLAAIQLAMTQLASAAPQCWAVAAAVEGYQLAGQLIARVSPGVGGPLIEWVDDEPRSKRLTACMTEVLKAYPWRPELHGQTVQLPFRFRAPRAQYVVDRRLVPWREASGLGQVAVWLDEQNSGLMDASLLGVKLQAGADTGLRVAERDEFWLLLDGAAPGAVRLEFGRGAPVAMLPGQLVVVPRGCVRRVRALTAATAAVVLRPGGVEGTVRAGALPTPLAAGLQRGEPCAYVRKADESADVSVRQGLGDSAASARGVSLVVMRQGRGQLGNVTLGPEAVAWLPQGGTETLRLPADAHSWIIELRGASQVPPKRKKAKP